MSNARSPWLHDLFELPSEIVDRFCQLVFDNARLFAVAVNPRGEILYVNRHLAMTLDRTPESLVGCPAEEVIPPDAHTEIRGILESLLTTGEPRHVTSPIQVANGEVRMVEWDNAVLRGNDDEPLYVLSFGNDVTERELANLELRASLNRYHNILDHAVDPIVTIDQRGVIQSFNRAAERAFGWHADELMGSNVSVLMDAADAEHHDSYIERYLAGDPAKIIGIGREVRGRRKDGTLFPLYLGVSEIREANGARLFAGICQDLSERKRVEEALRRAHTELQEANDRVLEEQAKQFRAEKLSSIGLLASGMAHEINNPLMGIISCVKALREGTVTAERREDYFEAVRDGLERIQLTVRSVLDYARQRAPAPESVAPIELIEGCLRLLAPAIRKKDLVVDTRVPDADLMLHADRSQLMQALTNLLLNAIYALPVHGHITVSAERVGQRIGLTVADDGPGIPAEVAKKVCDPFFTTKPIGEGTGLGLAVTLEIARAHRGDLEIQSQPGEGTRVTLWVPIRRH